MRPTVGRVVHYVAYGTLGGEHLAGACRAALVTEVPHPDQPLGRIGLAVLNPTGLFFDQGVPWADAARAKGGTWHWSEREGDDP